MKKVEFKDFELQERGFLNIGIDDLNKLLELGDPCLVNNNFTFSVSKWFPDATNNNRVFIRYECSIK